MDEGLSKSKTVANRARRAVTQASNGKLGDAFETYDLLFNNNFSAR
jgi:hypothetical protein